MLYTAIKIDHDQLELRPIVPATDLSIYKLTKWLVNEQKYLSIKVYSLEIVNFIDFINKAYSPCYISST